MFDIDGTLTTIGKREIPEDLARKLAEVSLEVPMAFATGRVLPQVLQKLEEILKYSEDPEKSRRNWCAICENGALGYFYNPETEDYETFYNIEWDESVIDREDLKERLEEKLGGIEDSVELRQTQILIRITRNDVFSEEILQKVLEAAEISREVLTEYPGNEEFEALESGIAVHLSPKDANKDQGIKRFAEYLGLELPAREILVVGDQPCSGGNDVALLRGDYGTPYTAGEIEEGMEWPLPILGDNGERLEGPEATLRILQEVEFKNPLR